MGKFLKQLAAEHEDDSDFLDEERLEDENLLDVKAAMKGMKQDFLEDGIDQLEDGPDAVDVSLLNKRNTSSALPKSSYSSFQNKGNSRTFLNKQPKMSLNSGATMSRFQESFAANSNVMDRLGPQANSRSFFDDMDKHVKEDLDLDKCMETNIGKQTCLLEEHDVGDCYTRQAEKEFTHLMDDHDDGGCVMENHFHEVGESEEEDGECHFDEENDIEFIVHEFMKWGFKPEEIDQALDSVEDLRAAIDFIDKEQEWQIDHDEEVADGKVLKQVDTIVKKKPQNVAALSQSEKDELFAFKLQVDEYRSKVNLPSDLNTMPMPPKFVVRLDKKSKKNYYQDNMTKKTQWTRPKPSTHAAISKMNKAILQRELKRYGHKGIKPWNKSRAQRALKEKVDKYVIDSQTKKIKHIRLPPDWDKRVDPKTGKVYFANNKTKQTQWTVPKFEPRLPVNWAKMGKDVYYNKALDRYANSLEQIYNVHMQHDATRAQWETKRKVNSAYRHAHRTSLKAHLEKVKAERRAKDKARKKIRTVSRQERDLQRARIHAIAREMIQFEKKKLFAAEKKRKAQREKQRAQQSQQRAQALEENRDFFDENQAARGDAEEKRRQERSVGRSAAAQERDDKLEDMRRKKEEEQEARMEEARRLKEEAEEKRAEDAARREDEQERVRQQREQEAREAAQVEAKKMEEHRKKTQEAERKAREEERRRKEYEVKQAREKKKRDAHAKAARLIRESPCGVRIMNFNGAYYKKYQEAWDASVCGQMKVLVDNTSPFNIQFKTVGSGSGAVVISKDKHAQFRGKSEQDIAKALAGSNSLAEAHQKVAKWDAERRATRPGQKAAATTNRSQAPVSQAGLPPGWAARRDASSGRIYYQNSVTKITQWKRPEPPRRAAPSNGLPPGWTAKKDAKSGRIYFQNTRTKTTSWNDPRPLPTGWSSAKDPRTGRTYYKNAYTKATSWADPRPKLNV